MSNTKIVIDKEVLAKLHSEIELFRNEPYDIKRYNKLKHIRDFIIENSTEIQIDQSIEDRAEKFLEDNCFYNSITGCYNAVEPMDLVNFATSQQIIEQLRVKEKELYEEIKVKEQNPNNWGWYKTDKGLLYYFPDLNEWSCNDSKLSEEYPSVWYKKTK